MPRQRFSENMPLIITIVVTVLIMAIGIGLLSLSSSNQLSPEEKSDILVRDDSIIGGNPDANVTLVEFSDFQCPACATYYPELSKVKETYGDRIKFVFRHFPLRTIHPLAQLAAEASEAAAAQDKFWDYHNTLYENQKTWSVLDENGAQELFITYAENVGVEDIDQFKFDLENHTYAAKVNKDYDDAERLNIQGTPTVFIDGKRVANPTYDQISAKLDELLAE